jgi:hypothetical protein
MSIKECMISIMDSRRIEKRMMAIMENKNTAELALPYNKISVFIIPQPPPN